MDKNFLSRKYLEMVETSGNELHLRVSSEVGADLTKDTSTVFLISVLGDPRKGKSSLLNFLSNAHCFRTLTGVIDPCTRGADLSNIVRSLFEFSGDDTLRDALGNVRFIDPEGTGNENAQYDITLFCSVLLVSAVVVFNWSGGLKVSSKGPEFKIY